MGFVTEAMLDDLFRLLYVAGEAILEIYRAPFEVKHKKDHTPLTLADERSHTILTRGLAKIAPRLPILSEEGPKVSYDVRRKWQRFWLVDPLDGTKEFIKRNGEFTVNVAIIEEGHPILGLVLVPDQGRLFLGHVGVGAVEIKEGERSELTMKTPQPGQPIRVVVSRSHPNKALEAFLAKMPKHLRTPRGSALKFCSLAAGEADFYPRLGPTWEWDTGAGQAVVEAAGGVVLSPGGDPLRYNKPKLINDDFLVAPSRQWLEETGLMALSSTVKKETSGKGR